MDGDTNQNSLANEILIEGYVLKSRLDLEKAHCRPARNVEYEG